MSQALSARNDAVFRALADPTRRAILDMLRAEGRSVNDLAAPFAMTQPAITQHLRVLEGAGLVAVRKEGRHRIYRLKPKPLRRAFDWLGQFERFWGERLDALGEHLDAERARSAGPQTKPGRGRR